MIPDDFTIAALYVAGLSEQQVADQLTVCVTTVRRALRDTQTPIREMREAIALARRHPNAPVIEELQRAYWQQGLTIREMSRKWRVDGRTVRKWLRESGVVLSSRKGSTRIQ